MARTAAFLSVVILLLFSTAGGGAFADGKRVALVIGNSNYTYAGQLRNPANDAKDIAAQLQKVGFDVIVLLDADRTRMAAAVEDFTSRIAGAEAALFYYAGHGIQYANRNWLIPIDVEVKSNTQPKLSLLALDEIQEGIADQKVGTTILVLDACRDNPFAVRVGTRAVAAAGLAAVKGGNDTYIAFSTEPGNVAVDGAGRNSPFADALLKAIPKIGQSLHKAMLAVKQEVRKATGGQQTPWTQDNLPADFYFVSLPTEPAFIENEEQDWALAKDSNNSAMLQSFLSKYPNGKNALAAQMALNRAALQEMRKELQSQQEIAIWNSVKDSNNPTLLKSYLRQYPKGIFAQQAEALLLQIDVERQARQAQQEAEKRREEQAAKEKELQKIEAERRVQELDAKQRADAAKNAAELKRLEEEKRKVQEELRLAKEAKDKAEAARVAAEKAAEQSRSEAKKEGEAAEDVAKKQQEAEKAREALKDAQRKKEQADKEAADRAAEVKKAEEARKAAEEAARVKAIKDAQEAEAKKAADEVARAKALKDAKDAEARKAAEEAARQKAIKDAQAKKDAEEKKAQEEAGLKKLKEEEQKTRDAEQAAKKQRQEKQRELEEAQRQQEQKDADAKRARDQQQQKRKPVEKAPYRPAGPPHREAPPRGGGGSPPIIHGL
jgi:hypothetical protein